MATGVGVSGVWPRAKKKVEDTGIGVSVNGGRVLAADFCEGDGGAPRYKGDLLSSKIICQGTHTFCIKH